MTKAEPMTARQKYRAFLSILRGLRATETFGFAQFDRLVRLLLDIPDNVPDATALLAARKRARKREEKRSLRQRLAAARRRMAKRAGR